VHHPGEVVETADVGNSFFDIVTVVVYPLNDDVACRFVTTLASPTMVALLLFLSQLEGRTGHLECKGGFEGSLRPRVEVDAELLEVGRGSELGVDARGSRLEEGELREVALSRLEELMCPGALKGWEVREGEETFKTVVVVLGLKISQCR
jgi:hypothetical protein